ncbi:hypothetical protein [Microbacterium sediminis]|uniref:DUF3137 domain-containing protein n=1 Tax=Microbacterium sediminis TaxID=904291 RepID=A0A1B9NH73_9MICO|nr:hypothetical protein [Microbacterium sediminis]OCG75957.1 hypothetical protein A7J15_13030 [Microbacterium sediminis]
MSTPAPQPAYRFDARPLTDPVDRAAVKAWNDEVARRGGGPGWGQGCLVAFMIAFCAIFVLTGLAMLPLMMTGMGGTPELMPALFVPFMFLAVPTVMIVLLLRGVLRGRNDTGYRLDRFARANGMSFLPQAEDPRLPGMIFNRGSDRRAHLRVRGQRPRFVEFANYRYTTGSGKEQTTHRWGYVAIHLDTPLPHIVLDALGNNSVFGTNLPITFDKDQRLSLEGDFDQHFALYCPQGYERDALYLFTPDIMARFIDHVGQLDVEIVDDWLFLYTRRDVSTLDPATWAWLFSVVSALMDKLTQWGRWRDERLAAEAAAAGRAPQPDPGAIAPVDPTAPPLPFAPPQAMVTPPPIALAPRGVAAPGQRLRRGWSWATVIVGVGVLAWFLINVVGVVGVMFR